MIEVVNNKVIVRIDNTYLIQEFNPDNGQLFNNEADCFNWLQASGWFDRYKQALIQQVKLQATQVIEQQAPDFKQRNAALGIYSAAESAAIKDFISQKIIEVNTQEQIILAATTLAELNALAPNKPTPIM